MPSPNLLLLLLAAALFPGHDDEIDPETLKALAARCGDEVEWAASWDEAADRARESGRPVLVLFRTLANFDLPDSAMTGPFMDPDIIELVEERYVALRFASGMQAPFTAPDAYGMGPLSFGTSVLVATADGEIVADTFTLEPTSLYAFLAAEAAEHGASEPAPAGLDGTERARWHARRGELQRAAALLGAPSSADELRLLAEILRRQRRGEEALAALDAARERGASAADVALEEGRVLMRLGRVDQAVAAFDRIPAEHPDALAAEFLRVEILLSREDVSAASRRAADLVLSHSESRWASLAAVVLSLGPLLEEAAGSSTAWPDEETFAALERSPWERLPTPAVAPAIASARRFLLATQRRDGSWVTPGEVMGGGRGTFVDAELNEARLRNPLTVATTALAAHALVSACDRPDVQAAIERALAFLLEARRLTDAEGDPFGVMDYTVWSKPCLLLMLADALAAGVAEDGTWLAVMEDLVLELELKQKSGGGWSYYKGNQLERLDPNLDVSFSFVTAYVLLGLDAARRAGVAVPEEMTAAALGCLERMRNDDGSFEYSLFHAREDAPRVLLPAGAAGRGPLCALALFAWERTDEHEVRRALDRFLFYRASYAREQGKTVMHCGTEGQGSHYLMFDYAWAAEAANRVETKARPAYREAVLDQIRNARLANGAYLDNPLLGDRYGAALGLLALTRM